MKQRRGKNIQAEEETLQGQEPSRQGKEVKTLQKESGKRILERNHANVSTESSDRKNQKLAPKLQAHHAC